jgi:hypothetical protein
MATAVEIEARLAELERQRASGVARVTVEGRTVEYRGLGDIERAIAALRGQLAGLAAAPAPVRRVRLYAEKDL